jgi:hypothetical protein
MSEIENEEYKEKDIVWAKTKGYPWWPSTISQISYKSLTTLGKTNKEKVYTIELIGEKNSAKVSSEKIEPFIKNYDKHANTKNSTLLKSIETAKKMCEKKTKKEKENEEQNKNNKDSKDNKESDTSPKFLQKKRNNDRVILDDDQNEEEKDVKIKNNEEQNNNKISTPKNNIKINININFTNNNQNTYNLNSVQTKDAMNQTNPNPNSNNLKSNTKTNIPKFNSINYSNLAANEKTTNKIKKEKIFNTSTDNNRDISISKEDEDKSIKSSKKEKKSENKDFDLKLGEKPEKENIEESIEENENEECEEDNEELILTNDIINESIQKILNCQVQISNISSQKTINKELTDLSEKFHELFDKNQNDNDNYEIYYLSKDLIPILLNLTYNKNTDIMSKSSEILSFLNEKIIKEIFNLSQKEKSDLIESLNNNKNKINKDEIYDNNNNIYNINSEEDEYKEGLNILELINKKATIKSGISDMHTIFSKRGRPKKISTNSELSSDVFSSKLNENFFNINTINEKNYYEEFVKILSIKDKTKMESDFKELIGDFFENIYDKNNSDLDIDIAKVRKNMCIKIYKVVKKIKPEVDRDLIKKMIIYFEYKIRNSNIDKIYSNKIKELFEIIKERLYVNDKAK